MQSVVAGLDDENYAYSSDDQEEQERSALFDEEDQVFFSDTDEIESAVPCSNGSVNNGEVSGTFATTFAIVTFTCLPDLNTEHILLSMLHIGLGLLLKFRGKKMYEFQKSLKPDPCGLRWVHHVDIKWRFVFPVTFSE